MPSSYVVPMLTRLSTKPISSLPTTSIAQVMALRLEAEAEEIAHRVAGEAEGQRLVSAHDNNVAAHRAGHGGRAALFPSSGRR